MLTADTITDDQIRGLRAEALKFGERGRDTVETCDTALRDGGNWGPSRSAARRACAAILNNASRATY